MNRKIGMIGSIVNLCSVAGFSLSMIVGSPYVSYLCSMGIAFGFLLMIAGFAHYAEPDRKVAGTVATSFAAIYATLILLIYFAQITAVRLDGLSEQALRILDYRSFGLYFSYDLLGYGLMTLATFFVGLCIRPETTEQRWLKALLMIHGLFFPCCFVMPMLGVFSTNMQGADWIGTALLEFWCAYFIPVGVLSTRFFARKA